MGIHTRPGAAATFFEALALAGVNLGMIATSEIRISVMVDRADMEKAVQAAHAAFALDGPDPAVVYAGTGR